MCVVVPLFLLVPVLWVNLNACLGKEGEQGEWLELFILLLAVPSKMEI